MPSKYQHLEDGEQAAVLQWAGWKGLPERPGLFVFDFLFAVPNGGKRGIREAVRFKRMGVQAGVSDLFFAYPCGEFAGMWIEMKKRVEDFRSQAEAKSAVRDEQRQFQELMQWAGYETAVCYGCEHAIEAITEYLKGERSVWH